MEHLTSEQLFFYLDALLAEEEMKACAAHLADCELCRGEFLLLSAVEREAHKSPLVEVSPQLIESIVGKVRNTTPVQTGGWGTGWRWGSVAGGAFLLGIFLFLYYSGGVTDPSAATERSQSLEWISRFADSILNFFYNALGSLTPSMGSGILVLVVAFLFLYLLDLLLGKKKSHPPELHT